MADALTSPAPMTLDMPLPGGTTATFSLPDDAPDRFDPIGMAEEAADLPPAEALHLLDGAVWAAASDVGALGDAAVEDNGIVLLEAHPPDDPSAYDALALYDLATVLATRAATRADDLPGALADFDAAIAVLASLHHVSDDGPLAAFGYDAAHLDAERADVHIERALARTHHGDAATDDLDRARTLAPADAGVLNNLADALRKLGRLDDALAAVDAAEAALTEDDDDDLREIVRETRDEILADRT